MDEVSPSSQARVEYRVHSASQDFDQHINVVLRKMIEIRTGHPDQKVGLVDVHLQFDFHGFIQRADFIKTAFRSLTLLYPPEDFSDLVFHLFDLKISHNG